MKVFCFLTRLLEVEDGAPQAEEIIALSEVQDVPVIQGRILSPPGKRKQLLYNFIVSHCHYSIASYTFQ